jgi:hypothetical protein
MIRWIQNGGFVEACLLIFGAAFAISTAVALGVLLFSRILRDWPERFLSGAAVLSLIVFALCATGLAYPAVFLALGALTIAAAIHRRSSAVIGGQYSFSPAAIPFALVFALYFTLYLTNAMAPEFSPDGAGYHLGFVSRFFRDHGLHRIDWDMYAAFPQGAEMLFLFAFAFGKHSAAAVVHFAFLVALAWQMILYSRRSGFLLQGTCAALLVFASPLMGKDGTAAYNDVALAAAAFALFGLIERWDSERDPRLLPAIGLIAGFAFSIKYTAALGIIWAIGFVCFKSRRLRPALPVAAVASLVVLPWLLRNWLWTGNPLAPLYNNWFPNPNFTTSFETDYRTYLAHYDLQSLWQIPQAVTVRGTLVGILGKVFKAAPLALLALHRREGRRLCLAALVFGAMYFSNIGARFLLPVLPFVALAMTIALGTGIPGRVLAVGLAVLHSYWSWPSVIPRYASEYVWRLHDIPWKWAFRFRPADEFLRERMPQYGLDRLIERVTEPGATVFTYRAIPEAYTSRRILVQYESEGNNVAGETLAIPIDPGFSPSWLARFTFPAQPLRAIRLEQSGSGQSQWRIYELRASRAGGELPRSAWRGDAKPFPWGIPNAFDSSLVTFWECGDFLRPGQSVTVDFGKPETIDTLTVQSGYAQGDVKLRLFSRSGSGAWQPLASPSIEKLDVPDLRRAAVEQLKHSGIGYVLLFEGDIPAKDIYDHPADWGIEFLGESDGGRLYKLR